MSLSLAGTDSAGLQAAAWVARCVGRGERAPLRRRDIDALATYLEQRHLGAGAVMFRSGEPLDGVWIVRVGTVELAVGRWTRRAVVQMLCPGDVDGDIQLLLNMVPPYTARAVQEVECLFLPHEGFERLLAEHAAIARRWLTSVAARLAHSHQRLLGLLGMPLPQQAARLLLDEAENDLVRLPQHTLAAMLGVRRSSLNKALRDFERMGLIRLCYRAVHIVDPAKLEAVTSARRPPSAKRPY